MTITISQRGKELIERHGGLRAAARVLEVDASYLSRLKSGEKDDPSDSMVRKLGLQRTVIYERKAKRALHVKAVTA
jgi:hypothetical protein